MKKKTIFSLILSALMLFSCSACNFLNNTNGSSDNNSSNSENSSGVEINDCTVTGEHSYKLSALLPGESPFIEKCGTFVCENCNESTQRSITTEDLGLPIVEFTGSLDGISKENKVKVGVKYTSEKKSFECDATLKVQGASSAAYPKKNFTIQLFEKETDFDKKFKVQLGDGWGRQSKYCLKANWIDFSHARNVVSAKLYGQVSDSRNIDDEFDKLVNGGAVDGYPVVIYLNGSFHGLYTWNIPKDSWLFEMEDETEHQALVMADDWQNSVALNEPMANDFVSSGWELEYCSTEDTEGTQWVVDSMNEMIAYLNDYTLSGAEYINGLRKYINVERAIDCMLHTAVLSALDNTAKNILWATYDGTQWLPCVYDMDSTWGLYWDGKSYVGTTAYSFELVRNGNRLWKRLYDNCFEDIKARYNELRQTVYSFDNIKKTFGDFIGQIPSFVYECEKEKWPEIPSKNTSGYNQIINFGIAHLEYLDREFNKI